MKTRIITLAMLLMAACIVKQKINSADIATTHSELNNAHPAADERLAPMSDYIEDDFDNDGTIDKAEKRESVIGDFNGDGKREHATIYHYLKPIPELTSHQYNDDYYHYCYIHFSDDMLTRIQLAYVGFNLVNEGDLNGDGCDELGFFNVQGNTMWGYYSVLTFVDGEWHELVCIRHNENWNPAPYQELVRKDPNNEHHLIVKEIRLDDGYILDKVVAIDGMNVTFRFDKTIGGYDVVMHWQPFEPKGCETGTAIVDFEDLGLRFQYVNNEKFSSYFIDEIVFDESFEGFKDGDEYTLAGDVTKASPYPNSPLDYYMPFQFYDVDFDGKDELLVNDWGRGQGGNCYTAYNIADKEIIEKLGAPFNAIDNTTVFDPSYETITIYGQDGVWYSYELTYIRVSKADVHEIDIPTSFDENLKSCLEKFASDIPSEFKIIGAQIDLGDHHYDLSVKNNSWYINE